MQHFIVVGAGLAGLSVAAGLVSAGASATLVDRTRLVPARGTSASWVLMDPLTAPTPQMKALIAASREMLRSPPRYFGPVLRAGGVLHVAASPQDFARLGDISLEGDRLDVEHRRLGMNELHLEYPELAPATALGGVRLESDAAPEILTSGVYDGMMKLFIHRGGKVMRETEVLSADYIAGGWRVETTQGLLTADALVNAAGAEAEILALRCGATSQQLATRRRSVVVSQIDGAAGLAAPPLRSPLICWAGYDGLVMRTEPHGEVFASPAEDPLSATDDPEIEPIEIAGLLELVQQRTRYRLRPHVRAWAGTTVARTARAAPTGLTGEPVISWDGRATSFFWIAGFGRHGVQAAPAAAAVAVDLILECRRERALYEDFKVRPSAFAAARS